MRIDDTTDGAAVTDESDDDGNGAPGSSVGGSVTDDEFDRATAGGGVVTDADDAAACAGAAQLRLRHGRLLDAEGGGDVIGEPVVALGDGLRDRFDDRSLGLALGDHQGELTLARGAARLELARLGALQFHQMHAIRALDGHDSLS
jgi:hypothetical protein